MAGPTDPPSWVTANKGVAQNAFQQAAMDAEKKKADQEAKHKAAMQKQKEKVDSAIAAADTERGIALLLKRIRRPAANIPSRKSSRPTTT